MCAEGERGGERAGRRRQVPPSPRENGRIEFADGSAGQYERNTSAGYLVYASALRGQRRAAIIRRFKTGSI